MIERKKIVVVGANGNISKEIIPLLLKNYEVHCLTRSVPSFAINSIFLKFIEGDALSAQTWDQSLPGKDAVISCFGVRQGEAEERNLHFNNLLIQKMVQHVLNFLLQGVKRLISFFSYGALQDGDHHVYQNEGFTNKERGLCHSQCIAALNHSELDYTAICLWQFKVGDSQVVAKENQWSESPADSEGVVAFLQQELEHPTYVRKAVFLHNKE